MKNANTSKNKHMTLDDRMEIQTGLDIGKTFKDIAKLIGKDPTTVSKEVKKHFTVKPSPVETKSLDGVTVEGKPCPSLLQAPFVCNPCKKKYHCSCKKQYYNAKAAHKEYAALLSEAREGIPLNNDEFYKIDKIIADGMKNGQRLYHIMQTKSLNISKSTVYRHLHRGYLSVKKLDFPRVVKFKARKQSRAEYIPKEAKVGRTYDDFLKYIDEREISSWVEMDTVIGRIGGKVIMTVHFTFCNFMFGILLDNKTKDELALKVRALKERLRDNDIRFGEVIPLSITDNGGEFADISAIIADLDGELETELFFCDPYQSSQKPSVEKNHTLFRDVVPKGSSFDRYTQDTVDGIFSHVNSITRKVFNGKTPYELFVFTFGDKIARLFGIKPIPSEEVVQSPKLLKKLSHTMT
jgi:IS30 family transposase